jgi:hypothetical protein
VAYYSEFNVSIRSQFANAHFCNAQGTSQRIRRESLNLSGTPGFAGFAGAMANTTYAGKGIESLFYCCLTLSLGWTMKHQVCTTPLYQTRYWSSLRPGVRPSRRRAFTKCRGSRQIRIPTPKSLCSNVQARPASFPIYRHLERRRNSCTKLMGAHMIATDPEMAQARPLPSRTGAFD